MVLRQDAPPTLAELLQATDRNEGRAGPGRGKAGTQAAPAFIDAPPTLAELVIDAYGAGEIELEPADEQKSQKFILPGGKYYSLATVARFLGWVKPSDGQATRGCREAFDAYGAGEIALAAPEPVHGMKATYDLPGGKSYSLATVARFLGWVTRRSGSSGCPR